VEEKKGRQKAREAFFALTKREGALDSQTLLGRKKGPRTAGTPPRRAVYIGKKKK